MKRVIAIVFVLSLAISGITFAAETMTPAAAPAAKPMVTAKPILSNTLIAKVESIMPADPVKGTKAEIMLVDSMGKKTTLAVKPTATIYDAKWAPITLDKIASGTSVKVRYTAGNEVTSINVIK